MMAVMCAYFFGVICGMGIMIKPAFGHEDHGFKHMTETSGSIVKEKYCGADISIWWIDNNLDGTIDKCTMAMLIHGKWHIKELNPINNECSCTMEGQ